MQVVNPEFETSVKEMADAIIEEESEGFQPGVESCEMHAERVRQRVRDSLHDFQHKFQSGFETIGAWLQRNGHEPPAIQADKLAIFDNKTELTEALNQGIPLYELIGFTPTMVQNMYRAAYHLALDNDFERGRDAFYFLVTLKPDDYDFWLGLAVCCTSLKEHEAALEASLRAIDVNPTKSDAYINALHLYNTTNDRAKALELCAQGSQFAEGHIKEPWAEQLSAVLNHAKRLLS